MTKKEFARWMEETNFSERHWRLDPVTEANKGQLLYYKGGVDGVFIHIYKDGQVDVGEYEDAVPHIGEAFFRTKYSRKVADNLGDAWLYITEKLGVEFLRDMFTPTRVV